MRGVEGFKTPFELQILLDGAVVHSAEFGGVEDDALSNRDIGSAVMQVAARLPVRLNVSAGLHRVGVTFVAKSFALEQKLLDPDRADLPIGNDGYGWPIVTRVLVGGPYGSTGPGDTPARRAIFTCRPGASMADTACADEILGRLALRAYGRPLDDRDRQTLRELYVSGSDDGRDFEAGIELALARILSGPEFLLYHGLTEEAAVSSNANEDDGAMLASRLALQTDLTRVISFKTGRDAQNRVFPESGSTQPFHPSSHHGNNEGRIMEFNKICKYRVGQVAYLLDKLKTTAEGDQSLLDKTVIVWGSPMADANVHNHRRCPLFLAGKGNGMLEGNAHLKAADGTPMANVMLTLLHNLGLEDLKSFGDSTAGFSLSTPASTSVAGA